jgi:hypothetical protein
MAKKTKSSGNQSRTELASSRSRHETHCTVCRHADRADVEQAFLNWSSPAKIVKGYSITRDALYRHAHALGLMEKRSRNVRAALERLIEHADVVQPNASAIVSAVATYAKINARGQWIERTEQINLNDLFDRMSREELERYAADGTLPKWFEQAIGSTRRSGATAPEQSGETNG